jgi:uncharacterized membrane protein YciS (DUF1049 family)
VKRLLLLVSAIGLFVAMLSLGWSFRSGNASVIELDLIWVRLPNVELWWVILVAIGIGAAGSTLIMGFAWMRARLLNRRYRRAIQRLEAELHELRSLPLMGSEPPKVVAAPERG